MQVCELMCSPYRRILHMHPLGSSQGSVQSLMWVCSPSLYLCPLLVSSSFTPEGATASEKGWGWWHRGTGKRRGEPVGEVLEWMKRKPPSSVALKIKPDILTMADSALHYTAAQHFSSLICWLSTHPSLRFNHIHLKFLKGPLHAISQPR